MESEWKKFKLSDVIEIIGGGTPKRSISKYWKGSIPWLSVKDFNNGSRYVSFSEESITELGLEKSSTQLLLEGQIIISARGTVGALAQLTKPMAFNQSCYGINAKLKYTTNNFIYYMLKYSMNGIKKITHGAVFDTITRETFSHININLPPISEQYSIAHILGSLDDKIEINRKMNKTLEAMSQAVFKSWFVDFDPVIDNALAAGKPIPEEFKARAEIRKSLGDARESLPKEVRALFSSEFVKTEEMGWIPKGWKIRILDELVDLIGGGTPKTSILDYWNGNIPWFSVVDAPNVSDVFVISTEKHVTTLGIEKSSTNILPIGVTIITARGTVGKCGMVGTPMAMNQSCYGIKGKVGISDSFVYYTVRNKVEELKKSGHGSVFNTITRDTFKTIKLAFGPIEITQELDKLIKPLFVKILSNLFNSRDVLKIRDLLLPKLLSGEIRISEAKNTMEKIT